MESNLKALTVDVASAAHVLGLGRNLVYTLVLSGRIRSIKVGRRRIIPIAALEEFLASELALQAGPAVASGNGSGKATAPAPKRGGQKQLSRGHMATPQDRENRP